MGSIVHEVLEITRAHWILAVLALLVARLVRNRFRHGLNKYPGPFAASLADWWRFVDVYKRRPELTHLALHAEHGDVVRLGPNTLSFADPAALKTIYGLNKGFTKVREGITDAPIWEAHLIRLTGARVVRFLQSTTTDRQRKQPSLSVQYHRQHFPRPIPAMRQLGLFDERTGPIRALC